MRPDDGLTASQRYADRQKLRTTLIKVLQLCREVGEQGTPPDYRTALYAAEVVKALEALIRSFNTYPSKLVRIGNEWLETESVETNSPADQTLVKLMISWDEERRLKETIGRKQWAEQKKKPRRDQRRGSSV